jgi:Glutathione-dependent formaldehyde-activating enzyme
VLWDIITVIWAKREPEIRMQHAAFSNALIEAELVELLQGEPEIVNTPSNSGKGQHISRCPTCCVALWSTYAGGAGDALRFLRVGTPAKCRYSTSSI